MSGPTGGKVEIELSSDWSPERLEALGNFRREGNRVLDFEGDVVFVFNPQHKDHDPNIRDLEAEKWYGREDELFFQE